MIGSHQLFIFFSWLMTNLNSYILVPDQESNDSTGANIRMFNFASHAAGAIILGQSPASAKGFNNLLNNDKDKYGISACSEKKWVVIGLSEDILVTSIVMANYEKYSSMLKDFQLLASSSYPTDQWIDLGTYTAKPQLGEQIFNITQLSSAHTRYLKIKFMTHYLDEALCTLSQIKVHGMTVIASLNEEVEKSNNHMREVLNHLNNEEIFVAPTEVSNIESASSVDGLPAESLTFNHSNSSDAVVATVVDLEKRNSTDIESKCAEVVCNNNSFVAYNRNASEEINHTQPHKEDLVQLSLVNHTDWVIEDNIEIDLNINGSGKDVINKYEPEISTIADIGDVIFVDEKNNAITTIGSNTTENEDSNVNLSTISISNINSTDNLIAWIDSLSKVPYIDGIFKEAMKFMSSNNKAVSQEQKDNTAKKISKALTTEIGRDLLSLPLQPTILTEAIDVMKRIVAPLVTTLRVAGGSTLDETASVQSGMDNKTVAVHNQNTSIEATESTTEGNSHPSNYVGNIRNEASIPLNKFQTEQLSSSDVVPPITNTTMQIEIEQNINSSINDAISELPYITSSVISHPFLNDSNYSNDNSSMQILPDDGRGNSTTETPIQTKIGTIIVGDEDRLIQMRNLIENITSSPAISAKLPSTSIPSKFHHGDSIPEVNYIQGGDVIAIESEAVSNLISIVDSAPVEPNATESTTPVKQVIPLGIDDNSDVNTTKVIHASQILNLTNKDDVLDVASSTNDNSTILANPTQPASDIANVSNSAIPSISSALNNSSSSISPTASTSTSTNLFTSTAASNADNQTLTCFENLSFPEFQAKMLAKLQQKSNSDAELGLSKDNNVFRALMQRIKSLEMNDAIVEMFTIQVVECYRTVTRELLKRRDVDSFVDQLEKLLRVQSNPYNSNHLLLPLNQTSSSPSETNEKSFPSKVKDALFTSNQQNAAAVSPAVRFQKRYHYIDWENHDNYQHQYHHNHVNFPASVSSSFHSKLMNSSAIRSQRVVGGRGKSATPATVTVDIVEVWSFNRMARQLLRNAVEWLLLNQQHSGDINRSERSNELILAGEDLLLLLERNSLLICLVCLLVTVTSLCTCSICVMFIAFLFVTRRPS